MEITHMNPTQGAPAMIKTLSDLLAQESKRINNGFCYCTYPFPCSISEALVYAKHYTAPADPLITREDNRTTIQIKPMKGSGKRKAYTIVLWWN
jgi:hypothetical protein